MRLAIIVLGLLCCASVTPTIPARPGECVTSCGMIASEGDCAELKETESAIVYGVGWVRPFNPVMMCSAVSGWRIAVHPKFGNDRDWCAVGWAFIPGFCVKGYTWVGTKTIELNDADWRSSSLAHEMVHVTDLARGSPPGHCLWRSEALRQEISAVTGRAEPQEPEPGCP